MTDLCEIMKRHGSDKGLGWHNYTLKYSSMWGGLRDEKLNLFELGLGTNNVNLPSNMGENGVPGASLRGWSEYFPNAHIYGADIDSNILFEEDRIKTYFCDQTSPRSIRELCDQLGGTQFDIIIDDGLHEYEANVTFLVGFLHRLKPGGYFIIEDLTKDTADKLRTHIGGILARFNFDRVYTCEILDIPNETNGVDNRIAVIRLG